MSGVDLVILFQPSFAECLVKELVWELSLSFAVGLAPEAHEHLFDPSHCLAFGDANICDAAEVAFAEVLFVCCGEFAVMGHTDVRIVCDEVKDIFFQICAGGRDEMNLVTSDHFGE